MIFPPNVKKVKYIHNAPTMSNYQVIDVGGKKDGNLWNRKIISNNIDGCFLCITHTFQSGLSGSRNHVRFLHVAADVSGDRIIGADHQGNIFLFDIEKNRFAEVLRIGISATSIGWNNYRYNEVLIALSNYELRCYNVVTKELVALMKGHTSAVHSISIHGSGRYALSSSFDNTILWDLNTFTKRRTLNGAQEVGVQEVFFLPNSNKIISCFKDDSIFVWDCETMKCLHQLACPSGQKSGYKCLAATGDSRLLISGGKSRFLHLWNLDSRQLIQVIELPIKIKEVKNLAFITDKIAASQNQLLAFLSQDGIIRFINLQTCKLQAEIGGCEEKCYRFLLTNNNRYVVSVLDNGNIAMYDLSKILNPQGVPPLVRKVENENELTPEKKNVIDHNIEDVLKPSTVSEDKPTHRDLPPGLNMKRLKTVLKGFGEYPAKYRLFIWRSILCLPENYAAFGSLVDKQTHNAFVNIHEKFPIKSRKLLRILQRVLSALAYWSPIFGETEFLPMMVFPIIKLFPNNQLICFEIIASMLLNWCQKWFEYFPNPPLSILVMIEALLAHHDAALLEHFISFDISAQIYAWPMLHTLFSEILTKDEWLIVWDNLFSNDPSFMLYLVVAYLIHSRHALLTVNSKDKFEFFFHHRNAVDIYAIIKETYRISSSTPVNIDPKKVLERFIPLTEVQYPIFDSYPRFVVDYLVEERERIRQDELDYLREKQTAIDIKKQKDLTKQQELAFYRDQEEIIKSEQHRRELIIGEENKLTTQRRKLQSLRREIALQELDVHDKVRRKYLSHQQQVKNLQLQRLDDELNRKTLQRTEETKEVLQDAEIKALEIEAQKRQFQEDLMRENIDYSFRFQVDKDVICKQKEKDDERIQQIIYKAQNIDGDALKNYQLKLGKLGQEKQNFDMETEVRARNRLWNLEREVQALQITQKDIENKTKESELHHLIHKNVEQLQNNLSVRQDGSVVVPESNSTSTGYLTGSFDSVVENVTCRGSFNERELDLMSQVRDLRRKIAHKK